jgi:hypothetical protein
MNKSWVLVVCCIILVSCVGSGPQISQQANLFSGHTLDEVWNASIQAIIDAKYVLLSSDKNGGLLIARIPMGETTSHEPDTNATFMVSIKQSGNGVSVIATVTLVGPQLDIFNFKKKALDNFYQALNKRLS